MVAKIGWTIPSASNFLKLDNIIRDNYMKTLEKFQRQTLTNKQKILLKDCYSIG